MFAEPKPAFSAWPIPWTRSRHLSRSSSSLCAGTPMLQIPKYVFLFLMKNFSIDRNDTLSTDLNSSTLTSN